MTTGRRVLLALTLLTIGLLAGVGLQHRWPLGRLRGEWMRTPTPAEKSVADLASLPRSSRLVIVAVGQSNAANYAATRGAAGAGVYAFHEGRLFAAVDPLPGGDGDGGSVWTRLGARLATTGRYDAVIFALAAQGSTRVDDWAGGGSCHQRLDRVLRDLTRQGLPPDFVLWHQGETEGRSPHASGAAYTKALRSVYALCREQAATATFVVARSTRHGDEAMNEQIRLAQTSASAFPDAIAGPDMDQLGTEFRSDGVHLNQQGAAAAADLWFVALDAALSRSAGTPVTP